MSQPDLFRTPNRPWNAGRLIGPKAPLKPKHVWAIRQELKTSRRRRDLALFNCALDSKLRACDLVRLRVSDVAPGGVLRARSTVIQQKTGRRLSAAPGTSEVGEYGALPWDRSRGRIVDLRAGGALNDLAGPPIADPPNVRGGWNRTVAFLAKVDVKLGAAGSGGCPRSTELRHGVDCLRSHCRDGPTVNDQLGAMD